jgi:hypothetical protein
MARFHTPLIVPVTSALSPKSGGIADIAALRICASFGLMHRSKQRKLFDHFVGAGEQKMRDRDLAELAGVKT